MQEKFMSYLKAQSNNNTSFVDEIASVLDIGYDAAYRRINLKTSITLEEAVKLARHYKISLNNLFEVGNQNAILTEISPQINSQEGLQNWLIQSYQNVFPLTKLKGSTIIYSAKDIPIFHTLKDSYLSRYKLYVWLKDIDNNMAKNKISFEEFLENIPHSLLESAFNLGEVYKNVDTIEIWNNTTINGTLQQVIYYFESGLLTKEMALKICTDIEHVFKDIEKQTIQQTMIGSKNHASYNLYLNEIHTLSNTIMVKTPYQKVFFAPFTVLSYFKIDHQPTCDIMYEFLQNFMSNSKLLVNAGEKDRTLFFNKMHRKIHRLRDQINANEPFSFE